MLHFNLEDTVFNQDTISACVTEEDLRQSELAIKTLQKIIFIMSYVSQLVWSKLSAHKCLFTVFKSDLILQ